jgi:hypothetical protein
MRARFALMPGITGQAGSVWPTEFCIRTMNSMHAAKGGMRLDPLSRSDRNHHLRKKPIHRE